VEVLIFDKIAAPLSYILSFAKSKSLLYLMTYLSFILRVLGGVFFWLNDINIVVLLVVISLITDSMDGKLSRAVFKKDPELRGTLDFLLDNTLNSFYSSD